MKEKDTQNFNQADERGQRFMKLYMSIQRYLYGFVLSLVANSSDADDIVQETVSVMWIKFDEFEPGTDFAAWAVSIARYRIMNYRQRMQTDKRRFSRHAVEAIDEIAASNKKKDDLRQDTLRQCMKKLSKRDQQVLYLRYEIGATLRNVAGRLGQNTNTLYSHLNRIHIALLHCIERMMSDREGMSS
ncbi:MAG: sigma-70 family RNA polymerase sigma factor [Sedimentisphaerales bacterium]|nr:sigma-70 family RNA polymerase sigma factor [Sedimentisphaerales bacterium]